MCNVDRLSFNNTAETSSPFRLCYSEETKTFHYDDGRTLSIGDVLSVLGQQDDERKIREAYPAVQAAWEQYQIILQLSK